MADDSPALPAHFSSFDDTPLPASFSSFDEDTIRAPRDMAAGTGLSGIPTAPATWEDVGHYGAAGLHELGATGAGFAASVSGDPATEAGWRRTAEQQQYEAEQSKAAATPTAEPGWSHPMLWAAEQAPGLAALAVPAAAATAVAGPVGAGAVLSGVMGAQTRGDVYNRLTDEGITPTSGQLAEATGIGMAQGVATELTGGLASKLPVSKLVGRALGLARDPAIFGAGAAGQEAVSQQAEVAAGQRNNVDPSDVGSAFVSGAEQGAAFSVPHLLGSGRHRDLTQTPGEASVAREDPAARQEQAKPRATAGGESAPSTTADASRQPPPSPLADPTLAAGAKGETVTPGSNQQAEPVVQQSEVAQPAPTAAGTATEGPPAGDTTGVGSPPPPPPEAQPAPGPAPAGEAVAPEPQATLQAQHADLLDKSNQRQLVVYNPGEEPLPLPKNQGFATTTLPDGRTAQYWRYGVDKLTAAKLADSTPDDLNRLLQSSTVNKNEAVNLAVAGVGEPAVVTTRRPDGTEVKAGATTTAVAPDDVALHKATAAPGDTVQVEHPATTIGERIAARKAEMDAAERGVFTGEIRPETVATPESKPATIGEQLAARNAERAASAKAAADAVAAERATRMEALKRDMNQQAAAAPAPTDRILRAEDETSKQNEAAQASAQEAVKGVTPEEQAAKQGKHWTKGELTKKENANQAANEIMQAERNHPKPGEQPNDILARAKGIVAEAKGIHVPTEISEEGKHGPGMMLLREAKDLVAKDLPKQNKFPSMADYARFLAREGDIREGRLAEALEARRNEGKEAGALGAPEAAAEGVRPGEHPEERSPEEEVIHREEEHEPTKEPGEARKLTENERRAQEVSERARAKLAEQEAPRERPTVTREGEDEEPAVKGYADRTAAFKVEKTRPKINVGEKLKPRAQELGGEWHDGWHDEIEATSDHDGEKVEITPRRSARLADIIDKYYNPKNYPAELRPMLERLRDAIVKIAGDTPVHFISHEDMNKVTKPSHGWYDPNDDHILINDDHIGKDTLLHEAFHAATSKTIQESPELSAHLEKLREELERNIPAGTWEKLAPMERETLRYALSHPEELLTHLMTNSTVQNIFKTTKISRELANAIGIPKWRKMTAWDGVLTIIQKALGLGPRDVSAIEAAMSLTEQTIWHDPRGVGELMAATGRMANRQMELRPRAQRMLDPEASHEDEERMPSRLREVGGSVAQAALDAKDNLSAAALKRLPSWMNGVELSRSFGKLFSDKDGNIIEGLLAVNRRKGAEMARRTQEDAEIIRQGHILADKYPDHQAAVDKLEHDATKFNVRAEEPPAQIKGKPHSKALDDWGHNAHVEDVHKQFNALPKELQEHHIAKREFATEKNKAVADQHIDMVLDNFPLPAGESRKSVDTMIRDNDLSDEAEEHYNHLGMLGSIRHDQSMLKGKAVYFNGVRDGDHVVLGKRHMPEGGSSIDYSGSELPENVREFATREEAHDFEVSTDMFGRTKIKYYLEDPNKPGHYVTEVADPATGKIVKASSSEYDARRYQTTLQHEHFEAHDTYAAAKRARQKMIDNGLHNVSDVLDKRKEGNWGRINTDAGQAMERRINDRQDMSAGQKRTMIDAARAYELVSRGGYQSHMMQRRNIAGAKYSSPAALRSYSNSVNRYLVNKQYAGQIDRLMQRLEAKDNENRTTDSGGLSSAVANEVRDRVYRSPDEMASKNAPWVNRLMLTAYMRWLVGPRHLLMMQTHPYAYSAPQMAGRHGVKIYGMLHQAAKDMGGDFSGAKTGLKATYDQARSLFASDPEKAAELATAPDVSKDMIGRLKNNEERAALTELLNSGELHSGFGDEFYGASGLKKVDALVRQLSSAQDAQNRGIVGLTAYRAERAKGGSQARAINYARDIIQDTMGVHSGMDVASVMKNPLARVFLQFKQFPMRQIELMARNVYNGFKGETPEVKKEAWKSFAHQVASGFTMAGVHGLPIGLLKPLGLLGMALGITPSPSQIDDRMRRYVAGLIGPTGANMLMDGALAAVPHAPDVSNMFSYDLDAMFGEPRGGDWKSYMAEQMTGAAGSTAYDMLSGVGSFVHGDVGTALNKLPLPRIIPDAVKAYGLSQHGKTTTDGSELTPASYEDAAWRTLGFGTQQQQRIQAGRTAAEEDIKEQKIGEQLKAKHKQKQTIMGVPVTAKNRALLRERENVYQ